VEVSASRLSSPGVRAVGGLALTMGMLAVPMVTATFAEAGAARLTLPARPNVIAVQLEILPR
jgi:hypothetical protein